MVGFFDRIYQGDQIDRALVVGYSDDEIGKIEKLYDISVTGDFREMLKSMGRCAGGLIGDDNISLYRSAWSVRGQVLFQVAFKNQMKRSKNFSYFSGKPFVFSWVNEQLNYFLLTKSTESDKVYLFDENTGKVEDVGKTLFEFMKHLADWESEKHDTFDPCCKGELLLL